RATGGGERKCTGNSGEKPRLCFGPVAEVRYTAAMDYWQAMRTKWRRLMHLWLSPLLALAVIASCQQSARIERATDSTAQEATKIAERRDVKPTAATAWQRSNGAQQTDFAEPPVEDLGGGE